MTLQYHQSRALAALSRLEAEKLKRLTTGETPPSVDWLAYVANHRINQYMEALSQQLP